MYLFSKVMLVFFGVFSVLGIILYAVNDTELGKDLGKSLVISGILCLFVSLIALSFDAGRKSVLIEQEQKIIAEQQTELIQELGITEDQLELLRL